MSVSDAAQKLQTAVDDVEWARNSGDAIVNMRLVDSLTESANALLREIHMQGSSGKAVS